eukprot:6444445-Pyramimonas_sp.AAC.1
MTPLALLLPRPNLRNRQARVALALAAIIRVLAVLLLRLGPMVQSMPRSLAVDALCARMSVSWYTWVSTSFSPLGLVIIRMDLGDTRRPRSRHPCTRVTATSLVWSRTSSAVPSIRLCTSSTYCLTLATGDLA